MNLRKIENPNFSQNRVEQITKKFGITSNVAELLLQRGIVTDGDIQKFLAPSISDMHDPFKFLGMDVVVKRIKQAVANHERILIFGDYDVDGITSTYILLDYFQSVGVNVSTFLPNRYSDGYGLTQDAVEYVLNEFKPNLIITVDCGISGEREVEYIKSCGVDVIVTDHHDCPEVLPRCPIIDAKLPNQTYPFRELCGAGVALKLVEALSSREVAIKYLPVCAIATVSDIVPLVDENRVIVKLGLDKPMTAYPVGIAALAKELKLSAKLTSQEVSFKLAPKLNAAGRMGNADHSLKLYIAKDKSEIKKLIAKLLDYNVERQDLCNVVYADCLRELSKINLANEKVIVLAKKGWSIGILGIVAARLSEEFNRPTFLLGEEGGVYKGSCRSIEGMNIHELLTQMSDLLTSFGGHTMAAGMAIEMDKIDEFRRRLNNLVNKMYPEEFFAPFINYDLDINVADVNMESLKAFEILEPYGCKNPMPVFKFEFEKATVSSMKTNPNHLNIQLGNVTLLAFNKPEYFNLVSQSGKKECVAELWIDTFRGNTSCKGIVKELQMGAVPNIGADKIGGEYLKQLSLNSEGRKPIYTSYNKEDLYRVLINSPSKIYGTLIIASTLQSYKDFLSRYKKRFNVVCQEYLTITNNTGYNTLCLCPSLDNNFKNYNRIILLDSVLDESYIVYLNLNSNAEIFLPNPSVFLYAPFSFLDLSRKTFGEYFNAIKKAAKLNLTAFDDYNYFNKLKRTTHNLNYVQFVCCVETFVQLNLIRVNDEVGMYNIEMLSSTPTQLTDSKFYTKLDLIMKAY
ncbi:MAG: single-stranded-DNA-specific exonuclease RecJ [Clostridia bacterium]|nr:single-stranded-DNA-specific exonuclease RecJ [Clostridia bacterium]